LESCELPGKQFVRTWSVRDTLSPYLILKLRLSVRRTGETGCSLWPTPDASQRGARATDLIINNSTVQRRNSGQRRGMDLQTAVKMWPTPTTRDYKDGSAESCKNVPVNGLLGRAVHMWPSPVASGKLNGGTRDFNKLKQLKEQGKI